jgi:hypothetical protein
MYNTPTGSCVNTYSVATLVLGQPGDSPMLAQTIHKKSTAIDHSSFLAQAHIENGPRELFGSFVLKALAEIEKFELSVEFASSETLVEVNKKNSSSWRPLLPVFNSLYGGIDANNFLGILGRDKNGDVVVCHSGRVYDWRESTCFDEFESMRVFYPDPEKMIRAGEKCVVTAKSTHGVSGKVIFSGAAWIRPDCRGKGLHKIFPRLGKVLSYGKWGGDAIISVMAEDVHGRGFAPRVGYTNVDWDIRLTTAALRDLRVAFLSMNAEDLVSYVSQFSAGVAEVDATITARSA